MHTQKTVWIVGGAAAALIIIIAFLWWGGGAGTGRYGPSSNTSTAASSTPGTVAAPVSIAPASAKTVAAIVASLPDAALFQSLYASAGGAALLTGAGPYTVFVPTDGAFAYLPPGELSNLTAAEKTRLVEYHIVPHRALDLSAVSSGTIPALSGDMLNFSVDLADQTVQVDSGWAIQEFKAKNGVVYTISAVLLPPSTAQP